MANTTWSTTDKGTGITLSGSNLVATANAALQCWVRAADKQVTGKFYWEITATTFANTASGVGIASPAATLASSDIGGGPKNYLCGVIRSGNIYVDGQVITGVSLGTITSGTVIGIAVDLTARLAWFRLGAAGNWNNSATANPAIGAGGIAHHLGGGIPALPVFSASTTSEAVTANFGDTAFTGTVPSGFTSGFTAGVTSGTNVLTTQVAIEHWLTVNTPAQVTQVAIEHWTSVQATFARPSNPTTVLSASRAGVGSVVVQ